MTAQRIYIRHDIDGRWHVLESVTLGASVVTRCRGRWPQSDAIRISDRPERGLACGGCEPTAPAITVEAA